MAEIRPMSFEEFRQLVAWAGDEGWNPGINDVDCLWSLDADGFLSVCEQGQFLGGGAIIRHSDSFGFMGLFIIDKAHRSRGLGTELWWARRNRLLERLGQNATIGLDGVDAMVPFYERGGFKQFTRHRRFQFDGTQPADNSLSEVSDLKTVSMDAIAELDRRCFPAERPEFLRSWIQQPDAVSLGVLHNNSLQGYGVMRRCGTGWKIGPLFAESAEVADRLFQAFLAERGHQSVFLDAPDNNPAAIALCERYGMTEVFGCERMYLGTPPDLAHNHIFGITTLETG
jgi:GNAT superfamily N-acetyltransferase